VTLYAQPIISTQEGLPLAGGPFRFARAAVWRRGQRPGIVAAGALPDDLLERLTAPRALPEGLPTDRPAVMGILNVTPDSFSDGGRHPDPAAAAHAMIAAGADIVDVGAESTRPGAAEVDLATERARLAGVLPALAGVRFSIDTRKAAVMADALDAGALIINDVSALSHDPAALALVAARGCWCVLMHHQGTPETMQQAPSYDDPLLDVYDWLEGRIAAAVAAGVPRSRIIADPGIGFGKNVAHNLAILKGLPLLHGLGVPILLGASRKSLISHIAGPADVDARLGGSLALALHGAAAGVQILRVHDVPETAQALKLFAALSH